MRPPVRHRAEGEILLRDQRQLPGRCGREVSQLGKSRAGDGRRHDGADLNRICGIKYGYPYRWDTVQPGRPPGDHRDTEERYGLPLGPETDACKPERVYDGGGPGSFGGHRSL